MAEKNGSHTIWKELSPFLRLKSLLVKKRSSILMYLFLTFSTVSLANRSIIFVKRWGEGWGKKCL